MEDQALATLRGQLVEIISGAIFVFVGLAACAIAAIRRSGVRLFLWLGIWSAMYGTGLLTRAPAVVAALLYTDGVIEPQNASGDSFGDRKLEEVVRNNQSRTPSELADQLLSEIRGWQPASLAQQDDITLIVIDIA